MKIHIKRYLLCNLPAIASMLILGIAPVSAVTVTVTIDGNGSGSVNSNPSGVISCTYPPLSGICSSLQASTSPVTLTATPSGYSLFSGWGGSCAACPDKSCMISMESDKSCSASFATLPPVRRAGNVPVYFWNLQEAFDVATNGSIIEARAVSIPENLITNGSGEITFNGGFDGSYTNQSGYSILQGSLSIRTSSVIADHLIISASPALAPMPPTQPAAISGNGQVSLSWPRVENAASYVIYYSSTPGVTTVGSNRIAGITENSYAVSPLTNSVTWYFRIAAVNSGGESSLSPEQSSTPFAQPPPAPTGFTVSSGNTELILQWDPAPGATSYKLYISDTPGVTKTTGYALGEAPNPCAVTLLDNGVRYYLVVTAVNSSGESAESNEASGIPSADTSPLVGAWGDLSISGASYYNSSTGVWASPSGVGARYEFKPDGTYTMSVFIRNTFYSCTWSAFIWTAGSYSLNGTSLTLAETEHYKKITDTCNSSSNFDGPLPPETKTYQWAIQEVADPSAGESWYTGPPTHTTLFLSDGVSATLQYRRSQ